MKCYARKRFTSLIITFLLVFAALSSTQADTISSNEVKISTGGVSTVYNLDNIKIEVENGQEKICLCRLLCFRALQTLSTHLEDGIVPNDDITIVTGWTTDGPEELFITELGWSEDDVSFITSATVSEYLNINDAVFYFTRKSTGETWKVSAKNGLYPNDFFLYRTLVKTGAGTEEQSAAFKNTMRPQAISNFESIPMVDLFDAVPAAYMDFNQMTLGGTLNIPHALFNGTEFSVQMNLGSGLLFSLTGADPAKPGLQNWNGKWITSQSFLDDPAMEAAYEEIAALAPGYEAIDVQAFMNAMYNSDFGVMEINDDTVTYYEEDGVTIRAACQYSSAGKVTASFGNTTFTWYRFIVNSPDSATDGYNYLLATQIHSHGGVSHWHMRYGNTNFTDLMENPDLSMWWPTLVPYDTTTEEMVRDTLNEADEFAAMLLPL